MKLFIISPLGKILAVSEVSFDNSFAHGLIGNLTEFPGEVLDSNVRFHDVNYDMVAVGSLIERNKILNILSLGTVLVGDLVGSKVSWWPAQVLCSAYLYQSEQIAICSFWHILFLGPPNVSTKGDIIKKYRHQDDKDTPIVRKFDTRFSTSVEGFVTEFCKFFDNPSGEWLVAPIEEARCQLAGYERQIIELRPGMSIIFPGEEYSLLCETAADDSRARAIVKEHDDCIQVSLEM